MLSSILTWLTWNNVGLLLTALGTAISCQQAYKAKKYKEEIVTDRAKLALVDLLPLARDARDACKKITTPADINNPLQGVDSQTVLNEIEVFCEKIEESYHRIESMVNVKEDVSKIVGLIKCYKNAETRKERYDYGDSMYTALRKISISIIQGRDII